MGRPKGACNIDVQRPYKDTITISFDRFQLLRSIAYDAKQVYSMPVRLQALIKELDDIEARDWIGLLDTTEGIAGARRDMVYSELGRDGN